MREIERCREKREKVGRERRGREWIGFYGIA
jgi:hypothetical protein